MNINYNAIWEGVKEVLRLAFFAALAAAAAWLAQQIGGLDPNSVWVIAGTVALRFVDKWIHTNEDINHNGVAPF